MKGIILWFVTSEIHESKKEPWEVTRQISLPPEIRILDTSYLMVYSLKWKWKNRNSWHVDFQETRDWFQEKERTKIKREPRDISLDGFWSRSLQQLTIMTWKGLEKIVSTDGFSFPRSSHKKGRTFIRGKKVHSCCLGVTLYMSSYKS